MSLKPKQEQAVQGCDLDLVFADLTMMPAVD